MNSTDNETIDVLQAMVARLEAQHDRTRRLLQVTIVELGRVKNIASAGQRRVAAEGRRAAAAKSRAVV